MNDFKCDYEKCQISNKTVCIVLPCGKNVCIEHCIDTNEQEIIECFVCRDHTINIERWLEMKRNRKKLKHLDLLNKIDRLEQDLESGIKNASHKLELNFKDFLEKIENKREDHKKKILKLIDEHYDKLTEKIRNDQKEDLNFIQKISKRSNPDKVRQTRKNFLKQNKNYGEVLFEFDRMTNDLENLKHLLGTPLEYEFSSDINELNVKKVLDKLEYKRKRTQFRKLFSKNFRGKCAKTIECPEGTYGVKCLDTYEIINFNKQTQILNIQNGRVIDTLNGHTAHVNCVEVIKSGLIFTGSNDCTIKLWDPETCQCINTFIGHIEGVWCVKCLDDDRIVSSAEDKKMKVWEISSGKCTKTIKWENKVNCLLALDSDHVIVGSTDIQIIKLNKCEILRYLRGHEAPVDCLELLFSGELLSGSRDKKIKIWDLSSGECVSTLDEHMDIIYGLKVLDDKEMISFSRDKTIKIWNIQEEKCIKTIKTDLDGYQCLTIMDTGEMVTCSKGIVKIWK